MAVGILLDVFVVRTFMVPALLTLVGQKSAWPRKSLRAVPDRSIDAPTPASV